MASTQLLAKFGNLSEFHDIIAQSKALLTKRISSQYNERMSLLFQALGDNMIDFAKRKTQDAVDVSDKIQHVQQLLVARSRKPHPQHVA